MQIKAIRIRNYKGFQDSGNIEFAAGMNVIVGQNNSGKTALMEAIGQFPNGARPHRSLNEISTRARDPHSHILYKIALSGNEIKEELLTGRGRILLQLPSSNMSVDQARAFFEDGLFERQEIEANLRFSAGAGLYTEQPEIIPVTAGNNPYAQIVPSTNKLIYEGVTTSSVGDGLP